MASTSASSAPERCFACDSSLGEGEIDVVKAKGVSRLLESSIKRKDAAHEEYLAQVLRVGGGLSMHANCRKSYNNEKSILAAVRRASAGPSAPLKPTRSKLPQFDFNNKCFLCEEDVSESFKQKQAKLPAKRRKEVVKVTLREMATTVLNAAKKREDNWGKQVLERIALLNSMETDLVAVNAEYHKKCLQAFYKSPKSSLKRGRPPDRTVDELMEHISFTLENSDECQFNLNALLEDFACEFRPDVRTIKNRLKDKYGEYIIISDTQRGTTICFKSVGHKILGDNWYDSQKLKNPKEERLRIVKAAGEIILEDIRSVVCNLTAYPPIENFLGGAHLVLPQTLLLLLQTIIVTGKKGSLDQWKNKCIALAHAIMIAVRPRSFLSSIMIGVATYIYKKFASKHLLDVLSSLGFSASYAEASRLEGSYVMQFDDVKPKMKESAEAFVQFIFDNADFNVNTLDGENTFHAMGGIMAVTPHEAVITEGELARLETNSKAQLISQGGSVPIKSFHRQTNGGLQTVFVKDIDINISQGVLPSAPEIAWLYGKNSEHSPSVPGWNGFMEQGTLHHLHREDFHCSKIVCMPFINAPPSDYNTIFTSVQLALQECNTLKQKTCILTFDQPLFWKARDLVAHDSLFPELRNVVVRLGGFHLLMSFMGAIGTIMGGSGLKELFCSIYATNSVDKILSGHAYARAVRGHMLAHAALAHFIFERLELTAEDLHSLDRVINHPDRSIIWQAHEDPAFQHVTTKFIDMLGTIECKGLTAALWVQYFRMCTLMKDFLKAERMGDWSLHLQCVKEMIPYFHAAGHLNYAKSAHLYYQDMICLQDRMDPQEYEKFTTKGFFTIRRSEKLWSGIWSDMTIEQVLMRAIKTHGGLTRGRGVSDSVISRWTMGMLCLQNICEEVETFADVRSSTSEQHVDLRPARVTRDNNDIEKLRTWFTEHPPFLELKEVVSLSTGTIGNESVNCHSARDIGICSMKKIVGQNFADVKLKRKEKVVTLASASCTMNIKGKDVVVDPLTVFQRVCIAKRSDSDLQDFFKYELAPFPMSLFTETGMRKGTKSMLYSQFTPVDTNLEGSKYSVIDGGYLLHKVVWNKHTTPTFESVCKAYVEYIQRNFGDDVVVVFDGYPPHDITYHSTKSAERSRRAMIHSSTKFVFSSSTSVTMAQESFLSNDANKRNLITMLRAEFSSADIDSEQADEDADCLIVQTAIEKAAEDYDNVVIVGEDIDLLVIMSGLAASHHNIFFHKTGRGSNPSVLYSTSSCAFGPKDILFLHAISGCDTTSAPYGIGKKRVCSVFKRTPALSAISAVFSRPDATQIEVAEAGEKFMVALYGGNMETDRIGDLRYKLFTSSMVKPKFQLSKLPPTSDASNYHAFRTYLQVQSWLGNQMSPLLWGWSKSRLGIVPITTTEKAAPDTILQIVSCKCAKGCASAACSCRKAGLRCSALCKHCTGHGCENATETDLQDDDVDAIDNIREEEELEDD